MYCVIRKKQLLSQSQILHEGNAELLSRVPPAFHGFFLDYPLALRFYTTSIS
jgi:hypothetical protein